MADERSIPADPPAQTPSSVAPRFNHVAMSMAADALDEEHRADILRFTGEVFGWIEAPGMTIDRERLVLMAHRYDQFVFLIADENPMTAPRLDHFGQSVKTEEEMHELYRRCVSFRQHDDRVDLIDTAVEEYPGLRLHAFYVGYLMPMMIETQYWEWT